MLIFDERFARQHRYGLPPDFRLASSYTSIVRNLSGPNQYAGTRFKAQCFDRAVGQVQTLPQLLSFRKWV